MHQTQLQDCIQLCAKHYFKITYSYMMMMTKNFNMPSGFKTIRAKHCLKITYNGYAPNAASRLHTAMRQTQLQDCIQLCAKHSFTITYSYVPNTASRLQQLCSKRLQDYKRQTLWRTASKITQSYVYQVAADRRVDREKTNYPCRHARIPEFEQKPLQWRTIKPEEAGIVQDPLLCCSAWSRFR